MTSSLTCTHSAHVQPIRQHEIDTLCTQLRREFPSAKRHGAAAARASKSDGAEAPDRDTGERAPLVAAASEASSDGDDSDAAERAHFAPMHVLPLYSMLPTKQQLYVYCNVRARVDSNWLFSLHAGVCLSRRRQARGLWWWPQTWRRRPLPFRV